MKKAFSIFLAGCFLFGGARPTHAFIDKIVKKFVPTPIFDSDGLAKTFNQLSILMNKLMVSMKYLESINQSMKNIGKGISMIADFAKTAGVMADWLGLHGQVANGVAKDVANRLPECVKVINHCEVKVEEWRLQTVVNESFWSNLEKHDGSSKSEYNFTEAELKWMNEVIYDIVKDEIREDIDIKNPTRKAAVKRKVAVVVARIVEKWRNVKPEKFKGTSSFISAQRSYEKLYTSMGKGMQSASSGLASASSSVSAFGKAWSTAAEEAKELRAQDKEKFTQAWENLASVSRSKRNKEVKEERKKFSLAGLWKNMGEIRNLTSKISITGNWGGLNLSGLFGNLDNTKDVTKVWDNKQVISLLKNDNINGLIGNSSMMNLLKSNTSLYDGLSRKLKSLSKETLQKAGCPANFAKDCSGDTGCSESDKKCYDIKYKYDHKISGLVAAVASSAKDTITSELKNITDLKNIKAVQSVSTAMGNVACTFGQNCANDIYGPLLDQANNSPDFKGDVSLNSTFLLQLYRQMQQSKHMMLSKIILESSTYLDEDVSKVEKTRADSSSDEKERDALNKKLDMLKTSLAR